uniref:Uncharacterized protein n=1 Tax=viral metagenome TaxID=1070528 RepID=A0A6C0JQM7_9ZZZZ
MNTEHHREFLRLNPHYVVTHHIYLMRDLSGNNPENIPPLEDGEYVQFMLDVNMAVRTGPLIISIYSDASGNNIVLDTNGNPVNNRYLKTTSYSYPYIDFSGNYIDGILTCIFGDGSSFSNNDENNAAYWYSIQGISDPNNLQQYT